mmetsp:Transcript_22895/g.41097  ORF Transcript_22895/g.41097 Transcript_22895/m.41097 type:complete len:571 (+) Transcript_22895:32-1744(+)
MRSLPSPEYVHSLFEAAANCLREARKLPLEHDFRYFEAFPEFNAQLQSQRAKLSSLLKRLCQTETLPYSNINATAHACLKSVDAVLQQELRVPVEAKKVQLEFAELIDNSSEVVQLKHPFSQDIKKLVFNTLPEFVKTHEYPLKVVDTVNDLAEMVFAVSQCNQVSLHTVQHTIRSYRGFACWIGFACAAGTFIVDCLKLRSDLKPLQPLLSDSRILKVFHDGAQLLWLQRDFGLFVVNTWDTSLAASALDLPSTSLTFLLSTYCRATPQTLPDWRVRPASPDCSSYLSLATNQLLLIKDFQAKELQLLSGLKQLPPQQLLTQVYSTCQEHSLKTYTKPPACNVNRTSTDKLLKWRDWTARQLDESPDYILPSRVVSEVVSNPESIGRHIASAARSYVPYLKEMLLPKPRHEPRPSGDLFELAGWVSNELPYARDYVLIAQSSSLRPEIFNTGLTEDCDAEDLRVCLEVYKQFNSRLPEKHYTEASQVCLADYTEDLDTQLNSIEVDENEIPRTMQQIYERSNRNRKKNKAKQKASSAVDVQGPTVEVDLSSLVKALGWNTKTARPAKNF